MQGARAAGKLIAPSMRIERMAGNRASAADPLGNVGLHLERLRRHYEAAVRSYDDVALLDLSHVLRIWTELKIPLAQHVPAFRTTIAFKTGMPSRKVLRAAKGHRYVFCICRAAW